MHVDDSTTQHVLAVVDEVLPRTGLAFVSSGADGSWAITKSTPGIDGLRLDALQPGQQLALRLRQLSTGSVVVAYSTPG